MTRFDDLWAEIVAHDTPWWVPKWTAAGRCTIGTVELREIRDSGVFVGEPVQWIPRSEFKKAYELWPLYRTGALPRSVMGFTYRSKYIISVLHAVLDGDGRYGRLGQGDSKLGPPPSMTGEGGGVSHGTPEPRRE